MGILSEWALNPTDISVVNSQIQELEEKRNHLHQQLEEKPAKQTDLSSIKAELKSAIEQDDIAIVDELIEKYGDLPIFNQFKELLLKREELIVSQKNENEISQLSKAIDDIEAFDFDKLKNLKDSIVNGKLEAQFDDKIRSFQPQLLQIFKDALSNSNWMNSPTPTLALTEAFNNLANLQSLLFNQPVYPKSIWVFEQISNVFKISFDYHFNSQRDTNRVDKPELFFEYTTKYLGNHLTKINNIFSLLETNYKDQKFSYNEFITSILPTIKSKISEDLAIIRKDVNENDESKHLLIHLIRETINFDKLLVFKFYYDPFNNGQVWNGLFEIFEYNDLNIWLNYEVKLNITNADSIISSSTVFNIDYTSVDSSELKPTISAIKLKYLFENITKNFQLFFQPMYEDNVNLQKFKLNFFAKIYLRFLESYLQRLHDGYDAFNEIFKKTKHLSPGSKSNSEIDITGVNGLERILRIYCSLKFTINLLNYYDQDLIFNQLNILFNQKSADSSKSLFNSILDNYNEITNKSFDLIYLFFDKIIQELLRNYNDLNNWSSIEDQNVSYTISIELSKLISTLTELIEFLSNVLPQQDLKVVKNKISNSITKHYLNSIIKSNHFNKNGVKQLEVDYLTLLDRLSLTKKFPNFFKIIECFQVMNLTNDQIVEYGNYSKLSQFGKSGNFHQLRDSFQLKYLTDSDIMDLLLRIN